MGGGGVVTKVEKFERKRPLFISEGRDHARKRWERVVVLTAEGAKAVCSLDVVRTSPSRSTVSLQRLRNRPAKLR